MSARRSQRDKEESRIAQDQAVIACGGRSVVITGRKEKGKTNKRNGNTRPGINKGKKTGTHARNKGGKQVKGKRSDGAHSGGDRADGLVQRLAMGARKEGKGEPRRSGKHCITAQVEGDLLGEADQRIERWREGRTDDTRAKWTRSTRWLEDV